MAFTGIDPRRWIEPHAAGLPEVPAEVQEAMFRALVVHDPETRRHFTRRPRREDRSTFDMMVVGDLAWTPTEQWRGLPLWTLLGTVAYELAAGPGGSATEPASSVPAGLATAAVEQLRRLVKLTREERDLVTAWRVWLGHRNIYSTTVDAQGLTEIDKRRTIRTNPIGDVLHDLKGKGVFDEKPSGWHVVL